MRIPLATYRLQFNAQFTFQDAIRLLPYLQALGISDIYASPLFRARAGSTHGYDVTSLSEINPEIGTREDFDRLVAELRRLDMGLLLDFVPNHMAASWENPWWWSVLEYGFHSPYATFFDIDWNEPHGADATDHRLLVPILGNDFGAVLESGELRLHWDDDGYTVRYYDHRFPLAPATYYRILRFRSEALRELAGGSPACNALESLMQDAAKVTESFRAAQTPSLASFELGELLKRRISEFRGAYPDATALLDRNLTWLNGNPQDPRSYGELEVLLREQPYRLANWRLAPFAVNYRRFFDINDLAGLRVELPAVFDASHREILRLIRERAVTGLRLDHIDGLYDPKAYLELLRSHLFRETGDDDFYVLVEKILGPGESIPSDWPVFGTTGYDFLSLANGIFVDLHGLSFLDKSYSDFTQAETSFSEVVRQGKDLVIHELFTGELEKLSERLTKLAQADRRACDVPPRELREALAQTTACLPVYRSYTRSFEVSQTDRTFIEEALRIARERTSPLLAADAAFAFVRRVLLLEELPHSAEAKNDWLAFVRRWQQFSGPAMAKGLEDTAFFRHTRLVSLNAVGGTPEEIEHPRDVKTFHEHHVRKAKDYPYSLNTTSTHDTKRSGDASARINVVSELPFAWSRAFRRWRNLNKPYKRRVGGKLAPDSNEEIFLYQTLIGSWPWDLGELDMFRRRIAAFMVKALREAKLNSSWIRINEEYEAAVAGFVRDVLDEARSSEFLDDFRRFEERIAFFGAWNALSQTVLKITAPAVPDIYQGDELWDFSLTDPDNRRPVDFSKRLELLSSLPPATSSPSPDLIRQLLEQWRDGRIKLFILQRLLAFRAENRSLFEQGAYQGVFGHGVRQKNVCAFLRTHEEQRVLVVVPRLLTQITPRGKYPIGKQSWGGTLLQVPSGSPKRWTNIFTGEMVETGGAMLKGNDFVALRDLLNRFPVAVLSASK